MERSDPDTTGGVDLPGGLVERLGAALVAPRRALAGSDTSAGQGKAPGDLALLFAVGFVAAHLDRLVIGGWLIRDGEVSAAVQVILAAASRDLSMPLLLVFAAGVVLTVAAGRRRSVGADFDLVCVAFVPALVVHLAGALIAAAVTVPEVALATVVSVAAYTWTAGLLVLAYLQTRHRPS